MSIKLLIAEGQEMARAGLRQFVAGTEIEVVAEAETGPQAVELALTGSPDAGPDVVLMAFWMPQQDGLAALEEIKQRKPQLPVIILANEDTPAHAAKAHARGAAGVLIKDASRDVIVQSVLAVSRGEQLWTRAGLRRIGAASSAAGPTVDTDCPLTTREYEILLRLVEGKTNIEIAGFLQISSETVKEHVQHILRKLAVADRTQAAVWAVRKKLV